ncbi:MAG TPA: toll/interleukin-1 receptor domain-containing protein [Phenylobacterium sp.]|jgi:tetratricopeptide (TPR) repeat protein|uniref:toll/interleukin-1 receptor domain-containing protein n=1 Tax=Phenylobacterium sp. TaxID=1871053 RepID=UPI002D67F93C|nr:toll/interleukin-1 receptor domain-containing protein [Phenylobacterium sp.]HZZ68679.1 toll/interleukin-1 receptor domain-containing protein [Phenylobacterium sp.]
MTSDSAEPLGRQDEAYAYRAFISYSHRDKKLAQWLHRELESYRIPAKLVGKVTGVGAVPRRLRPIFRDREELPASGDLSAELSNALRQSMFLLVICSPASARSRWVNEEILQFKRVHGDSRVLAVLADGEPYSSDEPGGEASECFPEALRYRLGEDGKLSDVRAEPIAADVRREADGQRLATQKLIAGLTGLKLDEVVRRENQRRIAQITTVAVGAMMGMVVTGGLAFYANSLRIEANEQRTIAQHEAAAARAASDYLVGTFELSNPAVENPRTITAMTILDRSAQRARRELADQPAIQARLLATLGRAYNNLGLYPQAQAALEGSMPAIDRSGSEGAEALLVLATTYAEQGQLDKGLQAVRHAETLIGPQTPANAALHAHAALAEGRILTSASKVKEGIAAFDRALADYRVATDTPPQALAAVLNNKGLLMSDDGQFAAAESSLSRSLALFQQALGPNHLSTGKAWFALAQNSFNAGDLAKARVRIANALRIERAVLDADNPTLGDTLSMQGQIYQGLGLLPEAQRSLREAIGIYRKAFNGPHYLIGIADVYLGLVQSQRGDTTEALATLDDAKRNYDASYGKLHPNHGDLLVNRAKVLARANRMPEARRDCAAGIAILSQTLGPSASFTKQSAADCKTLAPPRPTLTTASAPAATVAPASAPPPAPAAASAQAAPAPQPAKP